MKKFNFILGLLLLWIVGASTAVADDIVEKNYSEDFATKPDLTDPSFSPATGWLHQYGDGVEAANGTVNHASYSWNPDQLFGWGDKTPYFIARTQRFQNKDSQVQWDNDYLISPVIHGASSVYMTYSGWNDSEVRAYIYVMKQEDGKWVPDGDPIITYGNDGTCQNKLTGYYAVECKIPSVDGKRLGFNLSCVKFALFKADAAEMPVRKTLGFTDVVKPSQYADADADGNYTVTVTANVENTGNVDMSTDDDGYSVSLLDGNDNVIKTVALSQTLKPGEKVPVDLSFVRNIADYPNPETLKLREDHGKTVVDLGTYTPSPFGPKPVLSSKLYGKTIESGADINFGKTRDEVYRNLTIANEGGSELNITSIELPDGYSTNLGDGNGVVIDSHTSRDFYVKLDNKTVGAHDGQFVLNAGDATVKYNLKGVVASEDTWSATFESQKIPAGTHCTGDSYNTWSINTYKLYGAASTDNDKVNLGISADDEAMFVTPRLTFADGETLELDVAQNRYVSDANLQKNGVKIYYSADGENDWKLAHEIKGEELSNSFYGTTTLKYGFVPTRFVISDIPDGTWYIGFGSKSAEIDNIVGGILTPEPHDWEMKESDVPAAGEVNSAYTASVTLHNLNPVAEKVGTYRVGLYIDGDLEASTDGIAIPSDEEATITVAYTPHVVGAVKAQLKVESLNNDYSLETTETDVTIGEESSLKEFQAGNVDQRGDYYSKPMNLYYAKGNAEILYPASKLPGLKKGDKIAKLTFRLAAKYDMNDNDVKLWIENTEDEKLADPFTPRSTDEMTKVFDGKIDFISPDGGKQQVYGDYIVINFDQPFVYDGKSLRLRLDRVQSKSNSYVDWETDNTEGLCYVREAYYSTSSLDNYSYYSKKLPVAYFSVAFDPKKVSSNVTDKSGNAIAGAMVTLKSGDVEYYALTGEDGKYTANVVKSSLSYESTVEAPGYKDATDNQVNLDAPAAVKLGLDDIVLDKGDMAFLVASEDVSAEELADPDFSEDGTVYELQSVADNKAQFALATSLMKGHAYLFVSKADDVISEMSELDNSINLADEKTITLDGADIVTYLSRRALAPVDGKKTFRVVEGAFKAVDFDQTEELERLHMNYSSPFEGVLNVATEATELEIVLNDVPSGISTVGADKANAAGDIYTVSGVKVAQKSAKALKSGVYIMNGKKVVVK